MNYHDRIMNIPIPDGPGGESVSTASSYCHGHRDARHAAAEIATEADTLIGDLVKVCNRLFGIVRLQNGNLHDDINAIQDEAFAALASAKEKGFE